MGEEREEEEEEELALSSIKNKHINHRLFRKKKLFFSPILNSLFMWVFHFDSLENFFPSLSPSHSLTHSPTDDDVFLYSYICRKILMVLIQIPSRCFHLGMQYCCWALFTWTRLRHGNDTFNKFLKKYKNCVPFSTSFK